MVFYYDLGIAIYRCQPALRSDISALIGICAREERTSSYDLQPVPILCSIFRIFGLCSHQGDMTNMCVRMPALDSLND
jgi:hypothetical protein